jgi:hypothetical protein
MVRPAESRQAEEMATVLRTDVLMFAPWLLFGGGVTALCLRIRKLRRSGGRHGVEDRGHGLKDRGPEDQ